MNKDDPNEIAGAKENELYGEQIDWGKVPCNAKFPPLSRYAKVMLTPMETERLRMMAEAIGAFQSDIIRYALTLSLNSWSTKNNLRPLPELKKQWRRPKVRDTGKPAGYARDQRWIKDEDQAEE